MLGKIIGGRYHIVAELGRGAFSQTYLAEDRQIPNNPKCAVKQLKPQTTNELALREARRLFRREAEVLARLDHPQIPRLLAYYPGEFCLIQDFIDGNNLSQEIKGSKRWNETEVIKLLLDVLPVLEYVHQRQQPPVIHRDLKPSNLIRRASDGKIVLIDFGAVKEINTLVLGPEGEMVPSVIVGTQGYMPPEQLNGMPRPNSDIYALGMVAIQALTGTAPVHLPRDADREVIWHDRAQVCSQLADILNKMVRSDHRERYQSATEVLNDLDDVETLYQSPTVAIGDREELQRTITNAITEVLSRTITSGRPRIQKRRIWLSVGIVSVALVGGIVIFPFAWAIYLFNQANGLAKAGQYQLAIGVYDQVLAIRPTSALTWLNRGYALSKLRRFDEMLDSCNRAIENRPQFVEAWNCQGLALQELKRYQEALNAYKKVVELKPDFYQAWLNKGEVLLKLERPQEALAAFDKAILYNKDYLFAWNNRGNALFQLQRYPEAIAAYDKAIAIKANYPYAWNGRGNSHRSLKLYAAAIADYDRAIQIKSDFYEAWYNKGLAFLDSQQYAKALEALNQAIEIKPDYTAAINKREEVFRQLGR